MEEIAVREEGEKNMGGDGGREESVGQDGGQWVGKQDVPMFY